MQPKNGGLIYGTGVWSENCAGPGTGTYLSDGHVNLAILPLKPERNTEGPYLKEGFYHFGFQVDDVDALRPISEEMGATSKIEKRPENREVEARVYDPDGNPVDLSKGDGRFSRTIIRSAKAIPGRIFRAPVTKQAAAMDEKSITPVLEF